MNRRMKIIIIILVIIGFIVYSIWWYLRYTEEQRAIESMTEEVPTLAIETPEVKERLSDIFRKERTPLNILDDEETVQALEDFIVSRPDVMAELTEEPIRLEEFVDPENAEDVLDLMQEIRYQDIGDSPATACIANTHDCITVEIEAWHDAVTDIFFEDGTSRMVFYSSCDEFGYCFAVDEEGDEWEINYYGGDIEEVL